jgi:ADP-ribosyl-[dinitrogen reductase] hydrolase
MHSRTSQSDPLYINRVDTPVGGAIGLTFCPGKKDPHAQTGAWDRDLDTDLCAIRQWPAAALVTLIEDHEFDLLGVPELGDRARDIGLRWHHLPIVDVSVPDERFEKGWVLTGPDLIADLRRGDNMVIHCRGGLGRTGLVACRLLIELGAAPAQALQAVRTARPGTVETPAQEHYVLRREWER